MAEFFKYGKDGQNVDFNTFKAKFDLNKAKIDTDAKKLFNIFDEDGSGEIDTDSEKESLYKAFSFSANKDKNPELTEIELTQMLDEKLPEETLENKQNILTSIKNIFTQWFGTPQTAAEEKSEAIEKEVTPKEEVGPEEKDEVITAENNMEAIEQVIQQVLQATKVIPQKTISEAEAQKIMQDAYNTVITSTIAKDTTDKKYKNIFLYAKEKLSKLGKTPTEPEISCYAIELQMLNPDIKSDKEIKAGTSINVPGKSIDKKNIQILESKGIKVTKENYLFFQKLLELDEKKRAVVMRIISNSQSKTKESVLNEVYQKAKINLADTGLTIKVGNSTSTLESFITKTLKLDLSSKEGLKIYDRLCRLNQKTLNELPKEFITKLSKMNNITFDKLADKAEVFGIMLRTDEEVKEREKNNPAYRDFKARLYIANFVIDSYKAAVTLSQNADRELSFYQGAWWVRNARPVGYTMSEEQRRDTTKIGLIQQLVKDVDTLSNDEFGKRMSSIMQARRTVSDSALPGDLPTVRETTDPSFKFDPKLAYSYMKQTQRAELAASIAKRLEPHRKQYVETNPNVLPSDNTRVYNAERELMSIEYTVKPLSKSEIGELKKYINTIKSKKELFLLAKSLNYSTNPTSKSVRTMIPKENQAEISTLIAQKAQKLGFVVSTNPNSISLGTFTNIFAHPISRSLRYPKTTEKTGIETFMATKEKLFGSWDPVGAQLSTQNMEAVAGGILDIAVMILVTKGMGSTGTFAKIASIGRSVGAATNIFKTASIVSRFTKNAKILSRLAKVDKVLGTLWINGTSAAFHGSATMGSYGLLQGSFGVVNNTVKNVIEGKEWTEGLGNKVAQTVIMGCENAKFGFYAGYSGVLAQALGKGTAAIGTKTFDKLFKTHYAKTVLDKVPSIVTEKGITGSEFWSKIQGTSKLAGLAGFGYETEFFTLYHKLEEQGVDFNNEESLMSAIEANMDSGTKQSLGLTYIKEGGNLLQFKIIGSLLQWLHVGKMSATAAMEAQAENNRVLRNSQVKKVIENGKEVYIVKFQEDAKSIKCNAEQLLQLYEHKMFCADIEDRVQKDGNYKLPDKRTIEFDKTKNSYITKTLTGIEVQSKSVEGLLAQVNIIALIEQRVEQAKGESTPKVQQEDKKAKEQTSNATIATKEEEVPEAQTLVDDISKSVAKTGNEDGTEPVNEVKTELETQEIVEKPKAERPETEQSKTGVVSQQEQEQSEQQVEIDAKAQDVKSEPTVIDETQVPESQVTLETLSKQLEDLKTKENVTEEDYTAIRDEINKLPDGEEKKALFEQYLRVYNDFADRKSNGNPTQTTVPDPKKSVSAQVISDDNNSQNEKTIDIGDITSENFAAKKTEFIDKVKNDGIIIDADKLSEISSPEDLKACIDFYNDCQNNEIYKNVVNSEDVLFCFSLNEITAGNVKEIRQMVQYFSENSQIDARIKICAFEKMLSENVSFETMKQYIEIIKPDLLKTGDPDVLKAEEHELFSFREMLITVNDKNIGCLKNIYELYKSKKYEKFINRDSIQKITSLMKSDGDFEKLTELLKLFENEEDVDSKLFNDVFLLAVTDFHSEPQAIKSFYDLVKNYAKSNNIDLIDNEYDMPIFRKLSMADISARTEIFNILQGKNIPSDEFLSILSSARADRLESIKSVLNLVEGKSEQYKNVSMYAIRISKGQWTIDFLKENFDILSQGLGYERYITPDNIDVARAIQNSPSYISESTVLDLLKSVTPENKADIIKQIQQGAIQTQASESEQIQKYYKICEDIVKKYATQEKLAMLEGIREQSPSSYYNFIVAMLDTVVKYDQLTVDEKNAINEIVDSSFLGVSIYNEDTLASVSSAMKEYEGIRSNAIVKCNDKLDFLASNIPPEKEDLYNQKKNQFKQEVYPVLSNEELSLLVRIIDKDTIFDIDFTTLAKRRIMPLIKDVTGMYSSNPSCKVLAKYLLSKSDSEFAAIQKRMGARTELKNIIRYNCSDAEFIMSVINLDDNEYSKFQERFIEHNSQNAFENGNLKQVYNGILSAELLKNIIAMTDEQYKQYMTPVGERQLPTPTDVEGYRAQSVQRMNEPVPFDEGKVVKLVEQQKADQAKNASSLGEVTRDEVKPFEGLDKKTQITTSKQPSTSDLWTTLYNDGSVHIEIPDAGNIKPEEAAATIDPKHEKLLNVEENSSYTMSYGIKSSWSSFKIARDLLQNYYDGHGHTLEGVTIDIQKTEDGKYKVKISGKSTWDYAHLYSTGSSDKNGVNDPEYYNHAGGYGEGTRVVAVNLLRNLSTTDVKYASGDWALTFKRSSDDISTAIMTRTLTKNPTRIEGSTVEFETDDTNLVQDILDARNYFNQPDNPDFQNFDYENEFFGIKFLPKDQKGNVYVVQRYECDGKKSNGVPGATIVFKTKPTHPTLAQKGDANFELGTGADRAQLTTEDINRLLNQYVTSMSDDDLAKAIVSMKDYWTLSVGETSTQVKIWEPFVKEAAKRPLSIDFSSQNYVYKSDGLTDNDIDFVKNSGYKLAPIEMRDIGMKSLYTVETIKSAHKANTVQSQQIRILEEGMKVLSEYIDVKDNYLITSDEISQPKFMSSKGGSPTEVAEAIIVDGKYKGHWLKDGPFANAEFISNLATFLHELSHKAGGDTSAEFSVQLIDLERYIMDLLVHNPNACTKLRVLAELYAQTKGQTVPHITQDTENIDFDVEQYKKSVEEKMNQPYEYEEYVLGNHEEEVSQDENVDNNNDFQSFHVDDNGNIVYEETDTPTNNNQTKGKARVQKIKTGSSIFKYAKSLIQKWLTKSKGSDSHEVSTSSEDSEVVSSARETDVRQAEKSGGIKIIKYVSDAENGEISSTSDGEKHTISQTSTLPKVENLLNILETNGQVETEISDHGGLNPSIEELKFEQNEVFDVPVPAEMQLSYGGERRGWSNFKVARDIMQNFYDGNGHTLEGVEIKAEKTPTGTYKIRISGKGVYQYQHLIRLGGTTKTDDPHDAGGFGEGTLVLASHLLYNGAPKVRFSSGDWVLDFTSSSSDSNTAAMMRTLTKNENNLEGNYVEFETSSQDLVKEILQSRDYFYSPDNPDFQNFDVENEFFGFKITPGKKGNLYYIQRYQAIDSKGISNNDIDGMTLVFKQQPEGEDFKKATGGRTTKLDATRDRFGLQPWQIFRLTGVFARTLSEEDLIKTVKAVEPLLTSKDPKDISDKARNINASYEFARTVIAYAPLLKDIKFDFSGKKFVRISNSSNVPEYIIQYFKNNGYTFCDDVYESLGVEDAQTLYSKLTIPHSIEPNEVQHDKLTILQQAVDLFISSAKGCQFPKNSDKIYLFDETSGLNDNYHAILVKKEKEKGKKEEPTTSYEGLFLKDTELENTPFIDLLTKSLTEILKIHGETLESSTYSYDGLTNFMESQLNTFLSDPTVSAKLRTLEQMYNGLESTDGGVDVKSKSSSSETSTPTQASETSKFKSQADVKGVETSDTQISEPLKIDTPITDENEAPRDLVEEVDATITDKKDKISVENITTETEVKLETETKLETEADVKSETKLETDPETKLEAETEVKSKTRLETETKPEIKSETKTETENENKSQYQSYIEEKEEIEQFLTDKVKDEPELKESINRIVAKNTLEQDEIDDLTKERTECYISRHSDEVLAKLTPDEVEKISKFTDNYVNRYNISNKPERDQEKLKTFIDKKDYFKQDHDNSLNNIRYALTGKNILTKDEVYSSKLFQNIDNYSLDELHIIDDLIRNTSIKTKEDAQKLLDFDYSKIKERNLDTGMDYKVLSALLYCTDAEFQVKQDRINSRPELQTLVGTKQWLLILDMSNEDYAMYHKSLEIKDLPSATPIDLRFALTQLMDTNPAVANALIKAYRGKFEEDEIKTLLQYAKTDGDYLKTLLESESPKYKFEEIITLLNLPREQRTKTEQLRTIIVDSYGVAKNLYTPNEIKLLLELEQKDPERYKFLTENIKTPKSIETANKLIDKYGDIAKELILQKRRHGTNRFNIEDLEIVLQTIEKLPELLIAINRKSGGEYSDYMGSGHNVRDFCEELNKSSEDGIKFIKNYLISREDEAYTDIPSLQKLLESYKRNPELTTILSNNLYNPYNISAILSTYLVHPDTVTKLIELKYKNKQTGKIEPAYASSDSIKNLAESIDSGDDFYQKLVGMTQSDENGNTYQAFNYNDILKLSALKDYPEFLNTILENPQTVDLLPQVDCIDKQAVSHLSDDKVWDYLTSKLTSESTAKVELLPLSGSTEVKITTGETTYNITIKSDETGKPVIASEEKIIARKTQNGATTHTRKTNDDGTSVVEEVKYKTVQTSEDEPRPVEEHIRKTYHDDNGQAVRSEVIKPIEGKTGEYEIILYERGLNQKMKKSTIGKITQNGDKVTSQRELTSTDGTTTKQTLETTPTSSKSNYEIVSNDGKTIFSQERTFTKLDDNHTQCKVDGQEFDAVFGDDKITISKVNENGELYDVVELDNSVIDPQLIGLMKQVPPDMLYKIQLMKLNKIEVSDEVEKNNAQYNQLTNSICLSKEMINDSFVFLHELGHAIDMVMLNQLHQSPEFEKTYREELEAFKKANTKLDADVIRYFIMDKGKGYDFRGEVVAESVALLSGGQKSEASGVFGMRSLLLQQYFPKTIKLIAETIKQNGDNIQNEFKPQPHGGITLAHGIKQSEISEPQKTDIAVEDVAKRDVIEEVDVAITDKKDMKPVENITTETEVKTETKLEVKSETKSQKMTTLDRPTSDKQLSITSSESVYNSLNKNLQALVDKKGISHSDNEKILEVIKENIPTTPVDSDPFRLKDIWSEEILNSSPTELLEKQGDKYVLTPEADKIVFQIAEQVNQISSKQEADIVKIMQELGFLDNNPKGHRAKSVQGLHDKIQNALIDGLEKVEKGKTYTLNDAITGEVRDGVGTRQIASVSDIAHLQEIQNIVETGDIKSAIDRAIEIESTNIFNALKAYIDKVASNETTIRITKASNYVGPDGIPYLTEHQISELKAYAAIKDVKIPFLERVRTLAERSATTEDNENNTSVYNEKTTTKTRAVGYTAFQMNCETEDGFTFEYQYRGEVVNVFAEVEHLLYDIRTNKDIIGVHKELTGLYTPLIEAVKKLTPEQYKEHISYLAKYYEHLRLEELGFETKETSPKLPAGFDPILRAENLELLHDKSEKTKGNSAQKEQYLEEFNNELIQNTENNVETESYTQRAKEQQENRTITIYEASLRIGEKNGVGNLEDRSPSIVIDACRNEKGEIVESYVAKAEQLILAGVSDITIAGIMNKARNADIAGIISAINKCNKITKNPETSAKMLLKAIDDNGSVDENKLNRFIDEKKNTGVISTDEVLSKNKETITPQDNEKKVEITSEKTVADQEVSIEQQGILGCIAQLRKTAKSEYITVTVNGEKRTFQAFKGNSALNGGYYATDGKNLYIISEESTKDVCSEKLLANELYQIIGCAKEEKNIVETESGFAIMTKVNYDKIENAVLNTKDALVQTYAMDALLGNLDNSVILSRRNNSVLFSNDSAIKLLKYKNCYNDNQDAVYVYQLVNMFVNPNYERDIKRQGSKNAPEMRKASKEDLISSLQKVVDISDEKLIEIIDKSSVEDKEHLKTILVARKHFIQKFLENMKNTNQEGLPIEEYVRNIFQKTYGEFYFENGGKNVNTGLLERVSKIFNMPKSELTRYAKLLSDKDISPYIEEKIEDGTITKEDLIEFNSVMQCFIKYYGMSKNDKLSMFDAMLNLKKNNGISFAVAYLLIEECALGKDGEAVSQRIINNIKEINQELGGYVDKTLYQKLFKDTKTCEIDYDKLNVVKTLKNRGLEDKSLITILNSLLNSDGTINPENQKMLDILLDGDNPVEDIPMYFLASVTPDGISTDMMSLALKYKELGVDNDTITRMISLSRLNLNGKYQQRSLALEIPLLFPDEITNTRLLNEAVMELRLWKPNSRVQEYIQKTLEKNPNIKLRDLISILKAVHNFRSFDMQGYKMAFRMLQNGVSPSGIGNFITASRVHSGQISGLTQDEAESQTAKLRKLGESLVNNSYTLTEAAKVIKLAVTNGKIDDFIFNLIQDNNHRYLPDDLYYILLYSNIYPGLNIPVESVQSQRQQVFDTITDLINTTGISVSEICKSISQSLQMRNPSSIITGVDTTSLEFSKKCVKNRMYPSEIQQIIYNSKIVDNVLNISQDEINKRHETIINWADKLLFTDKLSSKTVARFIEMASLKTNRGNPRKIPLTYDFDNDVINIINRLIKEKVITPESNTNINNLIKSFKLIDYDEEVINTAINLLKNPVTLENGKQYNIDATSLGSIISRAYDSKTGKLNKDEFNTYLQLYVLKTDYGFSYPEMALFKFLYKGDVKLDNLNTGTKVNLLNKLSYAPKEALELIRNKIINTVDEKGNTVPGDIEHLIQLLLSDINLASKNIRTSQSQRQEFLTSFISNQGRNSETGLNPIETKISQFDFTQYGKDGLPLKYSRKQFIENIREIIKDLTPEEQASVLSFHNIDLGENGFNSNPRVKSTHQTVEKLSNEAYKDVIIELSSLLKGVNEDNVELYKENSINNIITKCAQLLQLDESTIADIVETYPEFNVDDIKALQAKAKEFTEIAENNSLDNLPTPIAVKTTNDEIDKYNQFNEKMKTASAKIEEEYNKFIYENEFQTNDSELNNILNGIMQGLPDVMLTVGKQQHKTHHYSVDVHTMEVLKKAMNDPEYKTLSDNDRTILKFSILLHDFGKKYIDPDTPDTGHEVDSAEIASGIIAQFKLPSKVKERILNIIKYHDWFAKYNRNQLNANQVAALFRSPEDYKIAKIMSKADLFSINPDFQYDPKVLNITENRTLEHATQVFDQKLENVDAAYEKMYKKTNIVMNSKILNPSKIPMDEKYGVRVLNLTDTNIPDDMDLAQYGMNGTTKNNLRLTVHMVATDNLLGNLESAKLGMEATISDHNVWSISMINLNRTRTYMYREYGFITDTPISSIAIASPNNLSSGYEKSFDKFAELLFADNSQRNFLKQKFVQSAQNSGYKISDDDYQELSRKIYNKSFLSQLETQEEISINGKVYPTSVIVKAIQESMDALFTGVTHSEFVAINPKIQGLVARKNSIDKVPADLIAFAKKYNLPILLVGNK